MRFLVLVCVVVVVSNCNAIPHWYESEYGEFKHHNGHKTECRKFGGSQMKEVRCMPRDTLVKLIPQPGFTFFPNYARVKRCSGYCSNSKSCMPIDANFTKIPVQMNGFNIKQCYNVLVEQHTKCKCLCSVKESHCNIHQQYNENNCACECMNEEVCDIARQMVWDNKLCKCVCKIREEECTNGLEWVPSRCRCAKVMDMPYNDK